MLLDDLKKIEAQLNSWKESDEKIIDMVSLLKQRENLEKMKLCLQDMITKDQEAIDQLETYKERLEHGGGFAATA